jgi:hypothetical protein
MGKGLYEIQAILTEIRGIKDEIKKLDTSLEISSGDWHKRRACQLLDRRIALLLDRLERIAHDEVAKEWFPKIVTIARRANETQGLRSKCQIKLRLGHMIS